MTGKPALRVLFVCRANLCRSVTAAELTRRAVTARYWTTAFEWSIESAGTDVAPGNRLPRRVARAMDDLGIPQRERPLMLTESVVRDADLILTAERQHRAVVAQHFPLALRHTFTLVQFARLLHAGRLASDGAAPASPDELIHLARIGRSHIPPVDDATIDIDDPVRARSGLAMRRCARRIQQAIDLIVL